MAADESDKTAMEMLFTFYTKPDKPLIIDGLSKLPIDEQLNIIKIDNISSQKGRKELTRSLFDKLPDLKDNAHKRIRFKSILSSYYKSYQELEILQVSKWKKNQVPLSLFIYLIKSLQSIPSDEKAIKEQQKAKKNSASFWKFIYYLLKYVNDQSFDGEALKKFYDEITNFGEKPGGFGLKFVQKICGQYSLKFGKFAKVKKNVGVWVTDNVNKSKSGSNTSNAYGKGKQKEESQKDMTKSGGSTTSTTSNTKANESQKTSTGTKSSGPPPKEQAVCVVSINIYTHYMLYIGCIYSPLQQNGIGWTWRNFNGYHIQILIKRKYIKHLIIRKQDVMLLVVNIE